MTMSTPPFAPPYKTRIDTDGPERWVEVAIDGRQTEVEPPLRIMEAIKEMQERQPAERAARPGVHLLNVPYAEKDEAKRLGAKWDATRRKWYVPAGVDVTAFSRWSASES